MFHTKTNGTSVEKLTSEAHIDFRGTVHLKAREPNKEPLPSYISTAIVRVINMSFCHKADFVNQHDNQQFDDFVHHKMGKVRSLKSETSYKKYFLIY